MITLDDIIHEAENDLISINKEIECDAFNGLWNPAKASKRDTLIKFIERLNEYKTNNNDISK